MRDLERGRDETISLRSDAKEKTQHKTYFSSLVSMQLFKSFSISPQGEDHSSYSYSSNPTRTFNEQSKLRLDLQRDQQLRANLPSTIEVSKVRKESEVLGFPGEDLEGDHLRSEGGRGAKEVEEELLIWMNWTIRGRSFDDEVLGVQRERSQRDGGVEERVDDFLSREGRRVSRVSEKTERWSDRAHRTWKALLTRARAARLEILFLSKEERSPANSRTMRCWISKGR